MIFLNFKTYPQTSGKNALKLCQIIKKVSQTTPIPVIACLQMADIFPVSQQTDLPVWAQHLDPIELGKNTGWLAPQTAKNVGATGTLLNHCEHPLDSDVIKKTVNLCRQHQLKIMTIASSLEQVKAFNVLKPDYIGFEDPQLIGGPTAMIEAQPDLVKQAVALAQFPLIVGGGMRHSSHVKKALDFGCQGILVASEFAKSLDPRATLADLLSVF